MRVVPARHRLPMQILVRRFFVESESNFACLLRISSTCKATPSFLFVATCYSFGDSALNRVRAKVKLAPGRRIHVDFQAKLEITSEVQVVSGECLGREIAFLATFLHGDVFQPVFLGERGVLFFQAGAEHLYKHNSKPPPQRAIISLAKRKISSSGRRKLKHSLLE